ncbi:hypothetical protein ABZ656_10830 [Streptomyces sp. NPDC007095]|uniref:hypothetical protein n=1 Tax=Streptomyces sp. NPDC007095 TaxID=3154482 RepID=UPI00101B54CB
MSTERRRLGTGPSTTSSMPPADDSPRLLPIERADLAALLRPPDLNELGPTRPMRRPLRTPRAED